MSKANKIDVIYWVSTALFSTAMTFSAYMYITNPHMKEAFSHLGFPSYFRVELAAAKIIGILILLAPPTSRLKEWAYAGFGITLVSAVVAHISCGDGPAGFVPPLLLGAIYLVSYASYRKRPVSTS